MKLLSISKLFPDDCLQAKLSMQGNLEQFEGRLTGTTTGIALQVIGEAMSNSGKAIPFKEGTTEKWTENLNRTIASLLCVLQLNHFDLQRKTLTYNINRLVVVTPAGKILTEI